MLTITQGPLPANGEAVDPSTFLEAWVSGTEVFGLDAGSFKGGTLDFIASSTNPPELSARRPGMMWFARGEGRLYVWDQNNLPSGASTADERLVNWLSISDRRDIWLKAIDVDVVVPGTNVQLAQSGVSNTEHEMVGGPTPGAMFDQPPFRVRWAATAFNAEGNPLNESNVADGQLCEVNFVALESAASGEMFRAVEMGFCTVRMAPGEPGEAGPLLVNESASETQWYIRQDPHLGGLSNTTGNQFLAFATDSSASNPASDWLRPAFKYVLPPVGTARIL